MFEMVAEIKATVETCSLPIESAQNDRLNALYMRIGQFVAENAVPKLQWSELQSYADVKVQSNKKNIAVEGATYCSDIEKEEDWLAIIDYFSSPLPEETEMEIDQMLSKPRLPVMNPCL